MFGLPVYMTHSYTLTLTLLDDIMASLDWTRQEAKPLHTKIGENFCGWGLGNKLIKIPLRCRVSCQDWNLNTDIQL